MTGNPEWMAYAEIDPELLALLASGTIQPPSAMAKGSTVTVQEKRDILKKIKAELNAEISKDYTGVSIRESTIPSRGDHEIPVRIYNPIDASVPKDGRSPVVVLFHGGGFTMGGLETEEGICRAFTRELGCVVINVDYRLAPEHPFPSGINDAWDSVQWVAKNASTLGGDPTAGFIVSGVSAGGNLAAVCGTLARDEKLSPPVTGLWLSVPLVASYQCYPPEMAEECQSFEQCKEAPVLNKQAWETSISLFAPDQQSRLFNLYSEKDPVSRAGLPPVYVQVCGLDPLRDEALYFERELRTVHKTPTRLTVYPGLPHGFWSFFPQLNKTTQWFKDTIAGVKWILAGGKDE